MTMQFGPDPTRLGRCGSRPYPGRHEIRNRIRIGQTGVEPDLHPIPQSRGADFVRTEQDLPPTRLNRPGTVGRGRPAFAYRERSLTAATPSTESRSARRRPLLVEQTNVQRVAAGDGWIGRDAVIVVVAQMELPDSFRHFEIGVRVPSLLIGPEPALERDIGGAKIVYHARFPLRQQRLPLALGYPPRPCRR